MPNETSGWASLTERNSAIRFIDVNLRGAGQVIFQNNPWTGLFFLLAIIWGAISGGQIVIAISAIVALIVATITAMLLDVDETSLREGMYGFNGVLVGAAVPTLLKVSPEMWFIVIIGAATSTVVMLAVSNVMKTWGAPALTFPFVLTTWFLVLMPYAFSDLQIASMGPPKLPHSLTETGFEHLSGAPLIAAWLKGPAQVFLINNAVSGVLIVIGLAISSLWAGGLALAGSAVGVILALYLGASLKDIEQGLFGFSAVLTAVGLGSAFFKPAWRVMLFALLGTIFTVMVQGALDGALAPLGIPTFTAPFVFATWLFLLPKEKLQPHPHAPIKNGVVGGSKGTRQHSGSPS